MIKVAIVGAGGYTGVELVKILLSHPTFKIVGLYGSEERKLRELYGAFDGVLEETIQKLDIEKVAQADLAFLALPHKSAMEVAKPLVEAGVKVVDLSADYRLKLENYEAFYTTHSDTTHLKEAVYGLPEIFKDAIEQASLIANPGCYPTASLLALIPFLPYLQKDYPIMIDAKSGVSGAGKKCTSKNNYVTINENIFAYNPIKHRHSIEIKEKLELLSGQNFTINFVPHLIPITRGMLVSCYGLLADPIDPVELLRDFYAQCPFVRIKEEPVDVKSVAGTHFCDIYAKREGNSLFLSSAIDNLLRGASSQAVVNANIMMGLEEELGIPKIAYIP